VDNAIEPAGASGRWRQNALGKALREDLTPAQNRVATEAAGNHHELNDTPPTAANLSRGGGNDYERGARQFRTRDKDQSR
jgi:hypothetical protein